MADKKTKMPVDPDIGKPDMSPQPNALDAAAQDAMLRPIQATPSPALPANMQDQGPSMEDLTRAQEMARQQLVKLPLRLAASRLSAIATHHDPNEVKEQDVANELTRESGLPEVMQRQQFEGARAKQILERAQGQHQIQLASQEEENARPTSAPNLATADMLNGMANAAGKMFGEEPPVYINRNTFTNANHLQSYSAFLDHWLSTKQAQAKEARLGPEADARLQEMKDKLEELTRHNKTTEGISKENADTKKNAPPKGSGPGGSPKVSAMIQRSMGMAAMAAPAMDRLKEAYGAIKPTDFLSSAGLAKIATYEKERTAAVAALAASESGTGTATKPFMDKWDQLIPNAKSALSGTLKTAGLKAFDAGKELARAKHREFALGAGQDDKSPAGQQHIRAFGENLEGEKAMIEPPQGPPAAVGNDGQQYQWRP